MTVDWHKEFHGGILLYKLLVRFNGKLYTAKTESSANMKGNREDEDYAKLVCASAVAWEIKMDLIKILNDGASHETKQDGGR